jgi:FMN phosphatase YigB (HAD superfamily)
MRAHRDFQWINDFEAAFFSCEVGAAKPDRSIYLICLEKLVSPLLVPLPDDSLRTLKGAGWAFLPTFPGHLPNRGLI